MKTIKRGDIIVNDATGDIYLVDGEVTLLSYLWKSWPLFEYAENQYRNFWDFWEQYSKCSFTKIGEL